MKQPSKEVLDAIVTLKRHRSHEFDALFAWLTEAHNDVEKLSLETPKAENVFTHWVALGNLQVLRKIVDTMDQAEDLLMQTKMR